jgi:hypothetical protein
MKLLCTTLASIVLASSAYAQTAQAVNGSQALPPQTTLPIVFTRNVDAAHVHAGEAVYAKTTQAVTLPDGQVLPAGSQVIGHIVGSNAFVYDNTPYAKQKASTLEVRFDTVSARGEQFPLHVYVRALASPTASWGARTPGASDVDPNEAVTQVGGDVLVPSQKEVRNGDGDVVEYNRHGGVYAHLIAASGNSPDGCDGSDTEQSMNIFSADACGLYGFSDVSLQATGRSGEPSLLVLSSNHLSPKIWKSSTALLEVLPGDVSIAAK